MNVRLRSAIVGALVSVALTPALGSAQQRQTFAVGGTAVMSSIHHPTKTITFTVRLLLYPACTAARNTCQITTADVTNIKKRITNVWNNGHMFSCYDVRVNIEIQVGTQQPPAGAGQVGIQIDQTPQPFVQQEHAVQTVPNSRSDWSSDDPAQRLIPENNPNSPTTWGWPSPQSVDVLAHEVGHILGLDDTYRKDAQGNPVDIPGSPHDVMNTGMNDGAGISQETINRLVRRHGMTESQLQCDRTIIQEETVHSDSTYKLGYADEHFRQDGRRTVTISLRNGRFHARTDARGQVIHTQTIYSQNAAGQPCTVVSEGITTYWGGGRGPAKVQFKDTVYLPSTVAARARGARDTDYRIDVTLPPEQVTASTTYTTVNGCGAAVGNPDPEPPKTHGVGEYSFVIEGHRPESARGYTGSCDKTVRTSDVGQRALQNTLPCFRFPDMGNRDGLWLMRHAPSWTSYLNGEVPFRVRTEWTIAARPSME